MNIYITYDDNTLFGTEVVYNTGGVGAVSVRCQCRCRCGGGGGCSVLPPLVPTVAALVDDGGGLIGRPGLHLHEVGVAMGALWADDLCLVTLLHVLLGQHEVVPLLLQGNLIGDRLVDRVLVRAQLAVELGAVLPRVVLLDCSGCSRQDGGSSFGGGGRSDRRSGRHVRGLPWRSTRRLRKGWRSYAGASSP